MKRVLLHFFFLLYATSHYGQNAPKTYFILTQQADSLFALKNYKEATQLFSVAFDMNGGLGKVGHRYKAASCWALLNYPDSAFHQLDKIAGKGNFTGYEMITTDSNFNSLHVDPRWARLIERIRQNKSKPKIKLDN